VEAELALSGGEEGCLAKKRTMSATQSPAVWSRCHALKWLGGWGDDIPASRRDSRRSGVCSPELYLRAMSKLRVRFAERGMA
jgi:hypothetical protein